MCSFGIEIPSETFMYMSKSSDPYRYAVTTSINCKDICFCIARDIKYQNVVPFFTGEYVSLKSILGLYVNPCVTSFVLFLTTSLFSFCFRMKPHLNPTRWTLEGVYIILLNISLHFNESSSTSIACFYLIQFECCLHFDMVLGSGLLRRLAAMVEKHELTTVVLRSNNSPKLV
jgi:hypothetical protein